MRGSREGGQWAITAQLSRSEAQSQKVESASFALIAPGGRKEKKKLTHHEKELKN